MRPHNSAQKSAPLHDVILQSGPTRPGLLKLGWLGAVSGELRPWSLPYRRNRFAVEFNASNTLSPSLLPIYLFPFIW